jgi:hypothetical protein
MRTTPKKLHRVRARICELVFTFQGELQFENPTKPNFCMAENCHLYRPENHGGTSFLDNADLAA